MMVHHTVQRQIEEIPSYDMKQSVVVFQASITKLYVEKKKHELA